MRSKLIAAAVSLVALAVPATAMAGGNAGAGSIGQAQINQQQAWVAQLAASTAKGAQNATNTNAPTNVAGGDVSGGVDNANQTAKNGAASGAGNTADTSPEQPPVAGSEHRCVSGFRRHWPGPDQRAAGVDRAAGRFEGQGRPERH